MGSGFDSLMAHRITPAGPSGGGFAVFEPVEVDAGRESDCDYFPSARLTYTLLDRRQYRSGHPQFSRQLGLLHAGIFPSDGHAMSDANLGYGSFSSGCSSHSLNISQVTNAGQLTCDYSVV